jgi:hypothetical protein
MILSQIIGVELSLIWQEGLWLIERGGALEWVKSSFILQKDESMDNRWWRRGDGEEADGSWGVGGELAEMHPPYDDLNRFCVLLGLSFLGAKMPKFQGSLVGNARLEVFLGDTF